MCTREDSTTKTRVSKSFRCGAYSAAASEGTEIQVGDKVFIPVRWLL